MTRGVEYLHSRKPPICHGDLKSINILVNSKCRAVITDFGSAHHPVTDGLNTKRERAIKEPRAIAPVEATFCTSTNTITLTDIQCTTRWAAPEVLERDKFSLASDIWALGWVAYEVMTNSIPFHDVKEPMVINRVVRGGSSVHIQRCPFVLLWGDAGMPIRASDQQLRTAESQSVGCP